MKIKSILISIAAVLSLNATLAKAADDNELTDAMNTATFLSAPHENIWPGFNINSTPTIFYYKNTHHLYAYNFNPTNPNWKSLDNGVFFLAQDDFGTSQYAFNNSGFTFVDNQKTFVHVLDRFEQHPNFYYFVLERFGQYLFSESPSSGIKTIVTQMLKEGEPEYAVTNKENLALIYLEASVLENNKNTEEALKDYAAIDHVRLQKLDAESAKFEKTRLLEQLGDYVAGKTVNADTTGDKEPAPHVPQPTSDCTDDKCLALYAEDMTFLADDTGYFGITLGNAFDQYIPGWKNAIESTATSLGSLIEQHYQMTSDEINNRFANAQKQYGYDQIKASVDKCMDPYTKEITAEEQEYQNMPGVEVILNLPVDRSHSNFSNFKNSSSISSHTELFKDLEQFTYVFPNKNSRIELKNLKYVYVTEQYKAVDSRRILRFKLPSTMQMHFSVNGSTQYQSLDQFIKEHTGSEKFTTDYMGFDSTNSTDPGINFGWGDYNRTIEVVDGKIKITVADK